MGDRLERIRARVAADVMVPAEDVACLLQELDRARAKVERARVQVGGLIGTERGLCKCCGRAHAVAHEYGCPVPGIFDALESVNG